METGIAIVVCSRETNQEKKEFLDMIGRTCGFNYHVFFYTNNEGVGLTKVYNDILDKSPYDLIVYIHDDIEFLKEGWGLELVKLFDQHKDYGIIGVAGSAEFDENGAWWGYDKIYGQVLHRGNGKAWLTAYSPLIKDGLKQVCVVDGLCFAIHRKRISKHFDEEIDGFHFYEIDFCLANHLDKKCKVGVTTNLRIAHESIGGLDPKWFENKEKVNKKYEKHYPIKI